MRCQVERTWQRIRHPDLKTCHGHVTSVHGFDFNLNSIIFGARKAREATLSATPSLHIEVMRLGQVSTVTACIRFINEGLAAAKRLTGLCL